MPRTLLDRVRVSDGTRTHRVEDVDRDFVYVADTERQIPVRRFEDKTVEVNVGQRVRRYLDEKVESAEHDAVMAAAVVVAAMTGYP